MRTALAHLWFALNFFLAFPALVLYAAGIGLRPPPGALAVLGAAMIVLAHVALLAPAGGVRARRPRHAGAARSAAGARLARVSTAASATRCTCSTWASCSARRSSTARRALLVYALGFWLLTHAYVVRVEEPALTRRFGAAYTDYCRRVGRWLPRLRAPD